MIREVEGNLLDAGTEALVNTVNSVGVMGKGIALQFKQAFPGNYAAYLAACNRETVQPGTMFVFHTNTLHNPKWIINFPTKRHWKGKSRLEDIEAGLTDLVRVVKAEHIHSIAIPPLVGCGNGGLDWNVVRKRIRRAFESLPDLDVRLYAPIGAPAPDQMRIATARPRMGAGRAAIVCLMGRYALPGYRLTLLEIQKLADFMQAAGEPLKLDFQKQRYGPYSETLHYVLQRMEGHFVRGYGDRSRDASLYVFPEALHEAEDFLSAETETLNRFERVSVLIDGFETPYGMELLSSDHWVATQEARIESIPSAESVIAGIQAWNERKRLVFTPERILLAWRRLKEQDWI